MIELSLQEFKLLKNYLHETCGIDIPEEKSYLFRTRLSDILEEEHIPSFNELYRRLKSEKNDDLEKNIIAMMTTNETSFFRDIHPFKAFREKLLPGYIEHVSSSLSLFQPQISIWSAGCSTGQEPYSIAMLVFDIKEKNPETCRGNVSILATDISHNVLEQARSGLYSRNEVERGLDESYRKRFFTYYNKKWKVHESIRKMITFREFNLSKQCGAKIGPFDFIFCRNVIIYFAVELKKKLLNFYHDILNPGGILMIGASENLYKLTDRFQTIYEGPTTYYRVKK
jgi:chemotaxis protein methyltransferase CheR